MAWTEYDPFTGMVEHNVADEETGLVTVRKEQDVSGLLDRNKEIANWGETDGGIKSGMWLYCSIPLAVQYELLTKHGVNCQKKADWPRMFDLINRDYPYLKTTRKKHAMRGGAQVFAMPKDSPKPATSTQPGKLLTSI
jgi:hypothetical protein